MNVMPILSVSYFNIVSYPTNFLLRPDCNLCICFCNKNSKTGGNTAHYSSRVRWHLWQFSPARAAPSSGGNPKYEEPHVRERNVERKMFCFRFFRDPFLAIRRCEHEQQKPKEEKTHQKAQQRISPDFPLPDHERRGECFCGG